MVEEAHSLINVAERHYPESTFVHTVLVPTTRAAIALFKARPADAINALQEATPTELGTVAGLVPFYLRGEAHLMKREYSRRFGSTRPSCSIAASIRFRRSCRSRTSALRGSGAIRRQGRCAASLRHTVRNVESCGREIPPLLAARAEYAALK